MNDMHFEVPEKWHGKPYYSLDAYLKNTYGEKIYKVALNTGLSCPNRDGKLDTRGCIFCSEGGSGDFAASLSCSNDFKESFARGKATFFYIFIIFIFFLLKYGKKSCN